MTFPSHLFFPLASSVGYVTAVLLVKRSAVYGVGVWRTTFLSNLAMAAVFGPLWFFGGPGQPWTALWQPLVAAVFFFLGQVATFLAMKGEVSVATPVLGLKILLVAGFSAWWLTAPIPWSWWVAAGLSSLAIALLNRRRGVHVAGAGRTVLWAALAAATFAAADVLVQKWAPVWGMGRFLPLMFGAVGALSFCLVPAFAAPLRAIPRAAWAWLVPGCLLLAVQSAGMATTLARFGDATAVNIVYSSRGLWSVLAVRLVGHWFDNDEQRMTPEVLRSRIAGAVLMLAAIALVLV